MANSRVNQTNSSSKSKDNSVSNTNVRMGRVYEPARKGSAAVRKKAKTIAAKKEAAGKTVSKGKINKLAAKKVGASGTAKTRKQVSKTASVIAAKKKAAGKTVSQGKINKLAQKKAAARKAQNQKKSAQKQYKKATGESMKSAMKRRRQMHRTKK